MSSLTKWFFHILLIIVIALIGCNPEATNTDVSRSQLFSLLSPEATGINFSNQLTEGVNTNVLLYEYFYNGGGVGIADVNNDGLQDIYFSSNMTENKLYLNKGDLVFEDVTSISDVAGRPGPWKTGVTMVDINGDDRTDIYLCYSGKMRGDKRQNQLFVNQGNDENGIPKFIESAQQYGIADSAYSNQAYFLDYDKDGDLDMFLLNHNPDALKVLEESTTAMLLKKDDPMCGVRLYRNDNNLFKDVTKESGISSSALTYGLGAGVADINQDGWTDIYISNDYTVPDYLYINNGDGTFTDQLKSSVGHISQYSMGNDINDINNDALPDIITLDMLPEDNRRQKLLFAPDNYYKFDLTVRSGFHHQYMRNMLHINNGNNTFSEVGQLAGISNTDWSWAPLIADFDNDGHKDLYVTNGYTRDYTNMDYLKYLDDYAQAKGQLQKDEVLELIKKMPSSDVVNYMYRNLGDLTFENTTASWGMDLPSNSNGGAFADLDNDGDLDLVISNINQPAFIYQNNSRAKNSNNYLAVKLKGKNPNSAGLGAKVTTYMSGQKQYLEQMPTRGYQSTVSPVLHFGLAETEKIDSLVVVWPSGRCQVLKDILVNQCITLDESNANEPPIYTAQLKAIFKQVNPSIDYTHIQTHTNDFKRQPLMLNSLSHNGPCMAKGDVNGDGLEDIYIGGGKGQAGSLFLNNQTSKFSKSNTSVFEEDKASDDVDAVFFDANGDSFLDLYVVSGGYHDYASSDQLLQDRLYLNDGGGNFLKTQLPSMHTSTSCVRVSDINNDNMPDLFVGGRVVPGSYPVSPRSYILINSGNGQFEDQTATFAPELQYAGMITDAYWIDLDKDGQDELIVVGEWMPISVYKYIGGVLVESTPLYFKKKYTGLWNTIVVQDFDKDGYVDLIVGNLGLNTQCTASVKEPMELYYKDFDQNGSIDPVLFMYNQGIQYPYVSRDELLNQLPKMKSKFRNYRSYADAKLTDVFDESDLEGVQRLSVSYLKTMYFRGGEPGFNEADLPLQAQYGPVFSATSLDFDNDGLLDVLLCGGMSETRIRFGKYDANKGVLFRGVGQGEFQYAPPFRSGFNLEGDVRSVLQVDRQLLFGMNQGKLLTYSDEE